MSSFFEAMSSRSDTESLRWIAQLDAALSENAAWMAGVADAVERLGRTVPFDHDAARARAGGA